MSLHLILELCFYGYYHCVHTVHKKRCRNIIIYLFCVHTVHKQRCRNAFTILVWSSFSFLYIVFSFYSFFPSFLNFKLSSKTLFFLHWPNYNCFWNLNFFYRKYLLIILRFYFRIKRYNNDKYRYVPQLANFTNKQSIFNQR